MGSEPDPIPRLRWAQRAFIEMTCLADSILYAQWRRGSENSSPCASRSSRWSPGSERRSRASPATSCASANDRFGRNTRASSPTWRRCARSSIRYLVLINTARRNLIDVQALMHAIADGKVRAAGLDVLSEEPTVREEAELLHSLFRKKHDLETLLANHVLLRLRNGYITPHSAFCTEEAVRRIVDVTVENIEAFARGEPQNVVITGSLTSQEKGYGNA